MNKDLTNKRVGRLIVLKLIKGTGDKAIWECRCDCGNIAYIRQHSLIYRPTKSCGCLQKEILATRSTTHHLANTRIYKIWVSIKRRCNNHKRPNYKNYGGRGITICDEWENDFMSFYNWSMQNGYAENLSIDRINNDGNYEPSNCRWTNRKTQANNTRHNHFITYNGKTQTLAQWCDELGFTYSCLKTRIVRRKWSIEKAFTTPARK